MMYWRPPKGDIDDRVRAIISAFGLRITMWNVDSVDWSIDAVGSTWKATDATALLDSVFQYGYEKYTGNMITWAPPGLNFADPNNNAYQGYISLEHELALVDLDVAKTYIDKIFKQPYAHFAPANAPASGMFSPALVWECDQATDKGPYLTEDEPFHKLVKYWAGSLPLSNATQTATEGVFDFVNANGAPGTPGNPTGGGTAAPTAPGQTQTSSVSVTSVNAPKSGGLRVKTGLAALTLVPVAAFFLSCQIS
ncbi:chitin deacetylase [Irineochytrium annulatum]|nr:chitin deacetylase [Irineochytrium annulatum]